MSACQRLSPPPTTRPRASSINLASALTFPSLGRRRSSSFLRVPADDSPESNPDLRPSPVLEPHPLPPEPAPSPKRPSPMLAAMASRFLDWLHMQPKHSFAWSTPSSPRSSTDDSVLPLSASAHKTSFPDDIQDSPSRSAVATGWRHGFVAAHAPILFVIMLFPVSTVVVLFCLATLPVSLSWPGTIADVAQLGRELHGYAQSGPGPVAHVVGVMAVTAVWKHAWSVPGSVIWNILAGALFSPILATVLLTALTMFGSACATLLAMPLAPLLTQFFPRALEMTRSALEGDSDLDPDLPHSVKSRSPAWVRLSVLRLVGIVPWSGINIACGVCGVPISDCMLGAFIGTLPWTAVTCQIGDILQTVASNPSPTPQSISSLLTSPEIIFKLIFLSFLSLAPILGRDHLRALISPSIRRPVSQRSTSEDHFSRWKWIQEWRRKIQIATRSRAQEREQNLKELNVLVQEKRGLEGLSS